MKKLKRFFLPWYIGFVATLLPAVIAVEGLFSKKRRAIPYLARLGHAYFLVAVSLGSGPKSPPRPRVSLEPSNQAPR